MSIIIENPYPYAHELPKTKMPQENFFEIFKVFKEYTGVKQKILEKEIELINQAESTIRKTYNPYFQSLGLIDNSIFELTKLGELIIDSSNPREEFLVELFQKRWFVFTLYILLNAQQNDEKEKFKIGNFTSSYCKDILEDYGFYVFRKSVVENWNPPNSYRIKGVLNLFYYLGITDINYLILDNNIKDLEETIRMYDESKYKLIFESIKENISSILNFKQESFHNLSQSNFIDFYSGVKSIYDSIGNRYIFVDDLKKKYETLVGETPKFYDLLWILYEQGKILLVPGRELEGHDFLEKNGRIYTTINFFE